jgi:hypothetical protein
MVLPINWLRLGMVTSSVATLSQPAAGAFSTAPEPLLRLSLRRNMPLETLWRVVLAMLPCVATPSRPLAAVASWPPAPPALLVHRITTSSSTFTPLMALATLRAASGAAKGECCLVPTKLPVLLTAWCLLLSDVADPERNMLIQ